MQIQLDMLRNVLGCTLPIELYHFPNEMQDPETRRFFVDNFDVQLKEVRDEVSRGEKGANERY